MRRGFFMKRKIWIIVLVLILSAALVAVLYFVTDSCAPKYTPATRQPQASQQHKQSVCPALSHPWLELPGDWKSDAEHCLTHYALMQGRQQRNYTILYDVDTYTSYWVAYPLCAAHTTTGREEIWGYDPQLPQDTQTSVKKGYGANIPTRNYPKNFYARGHQIPNADRNAVPQMQEQTYYSTNMTPQIQNGFNGGIWAKLEEAVRNTIPADDTLYIVTGASFAKAGEDAALVTIVNKNDGKVLPVPNYYWKVILKVRRDAGNVTDAISVGFWLPHEDLKGHEYSDYAVSVDQIEKWTGFDFFVNLQDGLELQAESNGEWEMFRSF